MELKLITQIIVIIHFIAIHRNYYVTQDKSSGHLPCAPQPGFLALAALIFGQWKPLGVLGATLFFGFAATVANVSQVIPQLAVIPPLLLKSFPYIVTLIALVLFSRTSRAPRASGQPYYPGQG